MKKGLILTELLISSVILSLVMLSVYLAFNTGLFGYKNIEETMDIYQTARQALGQIDTDLRNSFAYSENETKFTGGRSRLEFLSLVTEFSESEFRKNFSFVSYAWEDSNLTRLCKTGKSALNPNADEAAQELADNIKEIIFSYGYAPGPDKPIEWKENWEDTKNMPAAVKIMMVIKGKMPRKFNRTIFLPI